MAVELNHTIVHSQSKKEGSKFLSEVLGLEKPEPFFGGHFWCVRTANGVTLDYCDGEGTIDPEHYAFLVSEKEWDEIFGRIQERGLTYWADPMCRQAGKINHHDGGRGCYFRDPSGHLLEIITRPYGSGAEKALE